MGMSTYIITGRIPDQENETLHIEANCLADAIGGFIKSLYQNPDIEKSTVVKDWGVAVYIMNVDETVSEVKTHIFNESAWSKEAHKYEERKTAYQR